MSKENAAVFSKIFLNLVVLFSIILIGFLDYITGPEFDFFIFYIIPVGASAWYIGRNWAVVYSVFASAVWLIAEIVWEKTYTHPLVPYYNSLMGLFYFLLVVYLIVSIKTLLDREKDLSRTDPLTGIMNRRAFLELAGFAIERAKRNKRGITLTYIDLDNFKEINDNMGHNTGDILLRHISFVLQNNIRTVDLCARLGGDEFILMFPETEQAEAMIVVKKLFKTLTHEMKRNSWPVTFSVGCVTFKKPLDSVEEMIKKSDRVMYHAKKSGKNKIVYRKI